MAYYDKYGEIFSNLDRMVLAFDVLLNESITQEISLFDNPNTRKFIKQYRDELSTDNAIDLLKGCFDSNQEIYEKHNGDIPSQLYNDVESIMAAHGVLIHGGEKEFEQITWLK